MLKRPSSSQSSAPVLAADLRNRLKEKFESQRKPKIAEQMAKYLKNKYPFYGLKAPQRRQSAKSVIQHWQKANAIQEVSENLARAVLCALQGCKEREMHYVGAEFCTSLMRSGPVTPKFLSVVKLGVETHSWWDTVDIFAASAMSPYLLKCGGGQPCQEILKTMDSWSVSENLWLRRTAILCQMKLKSKTDLGRLTRYILQNRKHPDFFVQKAIGWALRHHAHYDPEWVRKFLVKHGSELSRLSHREASKHLK